MRELTRDAVRYGPDHDSRGCLTHDPDPLDADWHLAGDSLEVFRAAVALIVRSVVLSAQSAGRQRVLLLQPHPQRSPGDDSRQRGAAGPGGDRGRRSE
jgi:hypothetical protein